MRVCEPWLVRRDFGDDLLRDLREVAGASGVLAENGTAVGDDRVQQGHRADSWRIQKHFALN